jgi:hypothetical protein
MSQPHPGEPSASVASLRGMVKGLYLRVGNLDLEGLPAKLQQQRQRQLLLHHVQLLPLVPTMHHAMLQRRILNWKM